MPRGANYRKKIETIEVIGLKRPKTKDVRNLGTHLKISRENKGYDKMNTDMHRVESLVLTEEHHTLENGTPFKVLTITGMDDEGQENTFKFFTRDNEELTLTIL